MVDKSEWGTLRESQRFLGGRVSPPCDYFPEHELQRFPEYDKAAAGFLARRAIAGFLTPDGRLACVCEECRDGIAQARVRELMTK